MRAMRVLAAMLLAVGLMGCGEKPAGPLKTPHPAIVEAQTHFTYKGKRVPPFFLADFFGGPEAGDFWLREMGSRITAVVVEGLFVEGDGSYAGVEINDGEFVRFDLPHDESLGPSGAGWFGYKFLGTTPSGITVLEYVGNTGGSGTIPGVVFLRFEMESVGVTKQEKCERLVMRFLGAQSWGDRVYRDGKLQGNVLRLGPTRTDIPAYKDPVDPARTILLE